MGAHPRPESQIVLGEVPLPVIWSKIPGGCDVLAGRGHRRSGGTDRSLDQAPRPTGIARAAYSKTGLLGGFCPVANLSARKYIRAIPAR